MPVEVQREELEPCRVALSVRVPTEQFQEAVDRVFNQMAKRTQVPGFRPGKAPRRLVERYINQERVQELALERVLSEGFREALEQTGLRPYDEPDLKLDALEEGKPVSFRVTIPLAPVVELGEHRGLTFKRIETEITDADVDAELAREREKAARYEDIDEPAQEGDRVLASVEISVGGEVIPEAGLEEPGWLQLGTNLKEFDAGLQGITAGAEKVFQFVYPEDFAIDERRGRLADARVRATKVQRRILPEVDDAFAQGLGVEDLAALKAEIRSQHQTRAAVVGDQELDDTILQQVVARSTIHYPEEMVTREVADDISAFVKRLEGRGLSLQAYLRANDMDLQKLEADYAERARARIRNSLVLMKLASENDLRVADSDVEQEIERRATAAGAEVKAFRRLLEEQEELEALRNRIFYRKVLDFLKSVNTIEEKTG